MRQQKKGRRGLGEKAKTGRRLLPFGAMGREPCGRCGFWAKRCAAKPFPGRAGSLGGKDRRRQKPPSKGEGGAVGFFVCAKGPKAAPAAPSPGSPPVSRPLAGPHTRHRRRQFGLAKGCRRPKAHRETAGGLDPSAFSSPYASSPCKKSGDFFEIVDPDDIQPHGCVIFFPQARINVLVNLKSLFVYGSVAGRAVSREKGKVTRFLVGSPGHVKQPPEVGVGERTADEQTGVLPQTVELRQIRPATGVATDPVIILLRIFICQQGGHGSSPFLCFTCEVAAGCGGAGCQGQREPRLSPARVDARPARLLRRSSPAAPENGSRPGKSGAAFHGQGRCPAPCFRSV